MPNIYNGISGEELIAEVNNSLDLRGGLNADGSRGGEQIINGTLKDESGKIYYPYQRDYLKDILNSDMIIKRDSEGKIVYKTDSAWSSWSYPSYSNYKTNRGIKMTLKIPDGLNLYAGINPQIFICKINITRTSEDLGVSSKYYVYPRIRIFSDSSCTDLIGTFVFNSGEGSVNNFCRTHSVKKPLPCARDTNIYVVFDYFTYKYPGVGEFNEGTPEGDSGVTMDTSYITGISNFSLYRHDLYFQVPKIV